MIRLSELLADADIPPKEENQSNKKRAFILALEHQQYKKIPKTQQSYRYDAENTNTGTQAHFHVFAMQNGGGGQLYAVNMDGSGHDGSSGYELSKKHAQFLRAQGVTVPDNLTLESLHFDDLTPGPYTYMLLDEQVDASGEISPISMESFARE